MKTGVKVADAMTRKPVYISPQLTLSEVAKIMRKQHVGGIVVKDDHDVVGIITEQDIVRRGLAEDMDPTTVKAEQVMEPKLITLKPEADIYDALIVMRDNNIRHLPILSGKKLMGLLTIKDILKIEPQLFDLVVEKFELREEEAKMGLRDGKGTGVCQGCGALSSNLQDSEGTLLCRDCRSS